MKDLKFNITLKLENWNHIRVITNLGLGVNDLSKATRERIALFNDDYAKAIEDNNLDDQEFKVLRDYSKDIAQLILEEHKELVKKIEAEKNGSSALGILAGIGLVVGAIFGIRHLNQ